MMILPPRPVRLRISFLSTLSPKEGTAAGSWVAFLKSHVCALVAAGFRPEGRIMKILHYVFGKLIMVAIACSFAASAPIRAQEASLTRAWRASGDNASVWL